MNVMKYFFVLDNKGNTHVIVAADLDRATEIAGQSLEVENCYELQPDTFMSEGFLVSSK